MVRELPPYGFDVCFNLRYWLNFHRLVIIAISLRVIVPIVTAFSAGPPAIGQIASDFFPSPYDQFFVRKQYLLFNFLYI